MNKQTKRRENQRMSPEKGESRTDPWITPTLRDWKGGTSKAD